MAHPLSTLGIAHTLISLIPAVAGLRGFVRDGRIDPGARYGRVYLVGLLAAVLTSFGLSSTGGINPGHVLGVLALLAAFVGGLLLPRLAMLGRLRPYLQNLGLSFSFFLLMVPGINETLSRLPVGQPLATGPEDPKVRAALLAWLLLFVVGVVWQSWQIRRKAAAAARPQPGMGR